MAVFLDEAPSIMAEHVLNNGHFLRRLLATDAGFVEKLLGRIADAKEALSRAGGADAKALHREIAKIEDIFMDSVAEAGMEYRGGKLVMVNGDEGEEEVVRYSFQTSKTGMANDALLPYDAELSELIESRGDYIVDSYDKLVEVVNLAFENPTLQATAYFGVVDATILEKIENSVPNLPNELKGKLFKAGRDYSIAATLDNIRHLSDSKDLGANDIIEYLDKLADTIIDFDSVAYDVYQKGNDKHNGLLFKKQFSDGTYVSFDVTIQPPLKLELIGDALSSRPPPRGGLRAAVEELARMEYKSISGKEKITFYSRILPHPTSSGAPSQREPRDRANPPINSNLTCG